MPIVGLIVDIELNAHPPEGIYDPRNDIGLGPGADRVTELSASAHTNDEAALAQRGDVGIGLKSKALAASLAPRQRAGLFLGDGWPDDQGRRRRRTRSSSQRLA